MTESTPLAQFVSLPGLGQLVPSWGDEFDLRLYFAGIHPNRYQLRDERNYCLAEYLLEMLGVVAALKRHGIYSGFNWYCSACDVVSDDWGLPELKNGSFP